MTDILQEYLLTQKKLPLAGAGVLYLNRVPARFDVGSRQFLPPDNSYTFRSEPVEQIEELVNWLSARMGLEPAEVITRYQRFCASFLQTLSSGATVSWKGWGSWQKDEKGALQFLVDLPAMTNAPVAAQKIIRDNAAHQVRVGEESRSSVEMAQRLQQSKTSFPIEKLLTWSWLLLAAAWLAWQLYNRPFQTSSFADPATIKAVDAPKSYQEF
ncbi:MAG: hypothetical protein EB101_02160 [Chitinophagia bacterium]|nr:hypothetical protein [Chitinophagia bacterium]